MQPINHRTAVLLLRLAGCLLVGIAILCSPWLVARVDPTPPLKVVTGNALQAAQTKLFLIAVSMILFGELVIPSLLRRLFDKPLATKLLASALFFALPLAIAEIVLRPFTTAHLREKTTLFVRDAELGWRMRPDCETSWGGVRIKTNGKGLRGAEIPYARTPATPRILCLGDSVTFGYRLGKDDKPYPSVIDALLEDTLGRNVETVNAGVGGYSPWQQAIFLEREGLKYEPDIVILGFVLNDVVEKYGLARFGGGGVGYQLAHSYVSFDDWLRHNSAICALIRQRRAERRFGTDVPRGAANEEKAGVEDLARSPDAPKVQEAWSLTLKNLARLTTLCEDREIPLAVVVFPYAFQLDDPHGLSAPQRVLESFCATNGIPFLDLLPPLVNYLEAEDKAADALFLDYNHLSADGSRIVADRIVEWLRSEPTLWSPIEEAVGNAPRTSHDNR